MTIVIKGTSHNLGGCNFCGRTDFHHVREVQGLSTSIRFCIPCGRIFAKSIKEKQNHGK